MKRAVVDQPGFRTLFFGLILSIVLGLTVKSFIAPRKIKSQFDEAISRLSPDVHIDFESAQVKLSDWGWPQPYLEIHDIRISPVKAICDESQIFIETLSFPLTWDLFFKSKKVINSLRMTQLEVRLSEFKNCFSNSEMTTKSILNQSLLQLFSAHNAEQLRQIKVDRVKILSKSNYQMPIYLQGAVFDFTYANHMLSKVLLKSQLISYSDNQKQLFKIKSDFNLNIFKKNDAEVAIEGLLTGKLIDREYSLKFTFDSYLNEFIYNIEANQLSIKSMFKIIDFKHESLNENLKQELSSFVLTFAGRGKYDLFNNKFTEFIFDQLQFEADAATLEIQNLKINHLSPFEFEPFTADFKNFNLTHFLQQNMKSAFFKTQMQSGGTYTGQGYFENINKFSATGIVSDMTFYLVYLNEKWLQKINQMNIVYSNEAGVSQLSADHFTINSKKVDGTLRLLDLTETFDLDLSGQMISDEAVQKIMNRKQDLSFELKIKKDKVQIKNEVRALDVNYQGLIFKDVFYSSLKKNPQDSESIVFKSQNVVLSSDLADSQNDFIKFYTQSINLKKIEIEGEYLNHKYHLMYGEKNKKNKVVLDFLNNVYQVEN